MSGSAPPGQIYPGQYALEPQTTVAPDEGESWVNLAAIPMALAAASLSTAVAAASSFQYTEEICAQTPAQSQSAPSNQRARHQTLFIRWDQQDDLPAVVIPSAFDEDGWQPPVTVAARIPLPTFETEELPHVTVFEEDQPQLFTTVARVQLPSFETEELAVGAVFEEDGQPQPAPTQRTSQVPQVDEDLPVTPAVSILEESEWTSSFYAKTLIVQPWNVDDDFPTLTASVPGPSTVGGSYPQRAQHAIRFVTWGQADDLPVFVAPAVPDEVEGPNFPAKIREADGIMWATEEEIVPQPVMEEFYWQPYFTLQPLAKSAYLPDAEEFPAGNLFPLAGEEYHHFIPAKLFIPIAPVFEYDDVIVPQPAPLNVDEEYDIIPMVRVPVPQPVVVTFGGDEEMGDFVAPPEEDRDRGAKWPVKITEYLTKIKNRFYWFRDESELPKEEPAAKVVVAKVEPAVAEEVKTELEVQSAAEVAKRKQIERMNEAIMKLFI